MTQKVSLAALRRAAEFGELDGRNDLELACDYIRKCTAGGAKLNHHELWLRGRALYRQLAAGDEVSVEPTGLPTLEELAGFEGATDVDRAVSYLEATLGDEFESLDDAAKRAAAQGLLKKIQAAGADLPDGQTADDPALSAVEQARINLSRSAKFRALSHEQQCRGPEVRAEADRIRRLRSARSAGATHTLADPRTGDDLPGAPPLAPITPQPGRTDLPTLAEIRRLPPARGVQSDTARTITWINNQTNGAFAHNPWEVQVREAASVLRNIYAREEVPPAALQEPVRNPFGSQAGFSETR